MKKRKVFGVGEGAGNRRLSTVCCGPLLAAVVAVELVAAAHGAGTLTPAGSPDQPIQIRSHHVDVIINNGFARTEVTQTFFNLNGMDLEGIYSCPVPKRASLSEMTIWAGERELHGEVLAKAEADRIYEEEKQKGNDAGKAEKKGYQTFDFFVHPIRAQAETRVRFVYYQPLEIDTGVGRYLYPLEAGGTDDRGASFWTRNEKVEGDFTVSLTLKSAHPVVDARVPGYEAVTTIASSDEGCWTAKVATTAAALNRDFLFYYRLADDLPGRVEVIPYRADASQPGTFMLVVTPGIDLQPLTNGADYVYVLDKSGSMSGGKIQSLARGVGNAIGGMRPLDRFRVIAFDSSACEVTSGWTPATPENIRVTLAAVEQIAAGGSTDLHSGLRLALDRLDDDRATSIVLVTDGVANTGVISPKDFEKLISQYDVRIFGFVMGNSANWPLMDLIGRASGGFSVGVSNDDDIIGQIMLAKNRITHECLHDAEVGISGVKVFDMSDSFVGKVYRGQQLVLFGRYAQGGKATVALKARLTGEDKTYKTTFEFPDVDTANPEIERLWALNQVELHKHLAELRIEPEDEMKDVQRELGVKYQLVTDETTMLVVSDEVLAQRGIERRNQARVTLERQAQQVRASQPVRSYTVDGAQPAFPQNAPRLGGGGGGALDPFSVAAVAGLALLGLRYVRARRSDR